MRRLALLAALLVLVALAGCVGGLGPEDGDDGSPVETTDWATGEQPSETDLAFEDVTAERGFEYTSVDDDVSGNGNDGVYVADYDRDLREDVLALGDDEGGPVLFHNAGDGFERSGELPELDGRVTAALWFDHGGDGWEDLLLLRRNSTAVFLENDEGSLERRDVGLADEHFTNPVGASAADADGDGDLELFVIQYGRFSEAFPTAWQGTLGEEFVDNGNPNAYYDWDGETYVREEDAGIGPHDAGAHWSLATSFRDLTGDGHADVHVANDYYNDTLYVNRGDGTFERHTLGPATDRNGMSSTTADVTGDGVPEVFVTNIHFPQEEIGKLPSDRQRSFRRFTLDRLGKRLEGNTLLRYDGDGGYEDLADERGVADGGWGWAAVFADLDSDGQRDLFHTNQDVIAFEPDNPTYATPMVWLQEAGQFHRQDAPEIGFDRLDGRGAASLDLQVDGARDLAVGTYHGEFRLFRNDAEQGNSLQVDVAGDGERAALGATVTVVVENRSQRRVVTSRADYQSQDTRVLHVGLADHESVDELRVTWPDGTERTFEDVDAGQRIRVTPDGIDDRLAYGDS